MEYQVSDRGFKQLPQIDGLLDESIQVYESSNPLTPAIGLKAVTDRSGIIVQLSLDSAQKLAEQLTFLVANHHQNNT